MSSLLDSMPQQALDPPSRNATEKSQLVIVSNRLPVKRVKRRGEYVWQKSPGGLVSALEPILRDRKSTWIGWAGTAGTAPKPFKFGEMRVEPVRISADELRAYYDGFCNGTLWPLYHDAVRTPEFRRRWWSPYLAVNQRFAQAAAESASRGALVWVHDYQLQLVPGMLRAMRPDLRIGFFLHIPFPPQELFAQLPWRRQILEGLLGADVVGCQTRRGAQNFAQLARRYARAHGTGDRLHFEDHDVHVAAFPISIDFSLFEETALASGTAGEVEQLRTKLGGRRILLGVDRMDYTKGIDVRMRAFREMLQQGRIDPAECVLVQVAVPTRERVQDYQRLRERIEQLVGEINGSFGELGHTPVQYFHRGVPQAELVPLYLAADVMIVTPLRDGMNLVAKEYIASRVDETGVLVLSEFTGAARELKSALLVNPHDIDGLAATLEAGLRMPQDEQVRRMKPMRSAVRKHDVHWWAEEFFEALSGKAGRHVAADA